MRALLRGVVAKLPKKRFSRMNIHGVPSISNSVTKE